MQKLFSILFYLAFLVTYSQPNTEVFLFDLSVKNSVYSFTNGKNISNNEGYDNQPSFVNDNRILFASTRNGQTDIVSYRANYDTKTWINFTDGGEYTPLKIPNQNVVSAVRLDPDGKQRLYSYNLRNGESTELIADLVVAYYTWYNDHTIVSAVIEEENLNLYVSNLKEGWNRKYATNVGRSFHKIPNSNLVSFISKENDTWNIKSLNPETGDTKIITNTLSGSEDMCWMINGDIIMGKDSKLYKLTINKDNDWKEIVDLKDFGITKISRITGNSISNKFLIAAEVNGVKTKKVTKLEPKLENIAWISGTWRGEAFGGITEEIWSEPSGGSMMASFKLINDGKVSFYEIEIIREIKNSLILQLKHFNDDLKGWETKDETVDFPLIEITPTKVIFEGMIFEKVGDKEMNVYVDIHNEDGSVENVKFNYKKD